MKTKVDGVTITLTDEQVKYIQEAKAKRRKNRKPFGSVLLRFGFELDMIDKSGNACYLHQEKGWWAEIYDGNRVWMLGGGLRHDEAYPGGHMYHTPEELIEELEKQL